MFRFSNRTKIPTNTDLQADEYFAPQTEEQQQSGPFKLIASKPLKKDTIRAKAQELKSKVKTTFKETEHFLLENFKHG